MHGDRALVGAPHGAALVSALVTTAPGEVYAYERAGGTWTQTQRIRSSSPNVNDAFGTSIALRDDAALIGAANEASGGRGRGADASRRDAGYSGSGYLYALDDGRWKLSTYLKASNTDPNDSFGFSVALSGDMAVLSANWESSDGHSNADNNGANRSGALYVFE